MHQCMGANMKNTNSTESEQVLKNILQASQITGCMAAVKMHSLGKPTYSIQQQHLK